MAGGAEVGPPAGGTETWARAAYEAVGGPGTKVTWRLHPPMLRAAGLKQNLIDANAARPVGADGLTPEPTDEFREVLRQAVAAHDTMFAQEIRHARRAPGHLRERETRAAAGGIVDDP